MALFRLRKRKGERYATTPFHEAADRGAYLRPKKKLTLFNRRGDTIRPGREDRYEMERPRGLFGKRKSGGNTKSKPSQKQRRQQPIRNTGMADDARRVANYRAKLSQGNRYMPETVDTLTSSYAQYLKRARSK